jgi:predicted helicase
MHQVKFKDFNKNFDKYVEELNKKLKTGISKEHSHRPAFQNFIESITGFDAVNDGKAISCGAPDFIIQKSLITYGHVETKDIGIDLTKIEETEQLKRYLPALNNLILTDYVEFRWYDNAELKMTVNIGTLSNKIITVQQSEIKNFELLLKNFFKSTRTTVSTPNELADVLADKARILESSLTEAFLRENENGYFHKQLDALKNSIFPHITIDKFLDLYTQTVCYGLFVARCSSPEMKNFNRTNSVLCFPRSDTFLKKLFIEVSSKKLDSSITWIIDDISELLAKSDIKKIIKNFGKSKGKMDPVIYFYEEFLSKYNPKLKIARGDFYTPIQVVSYLVNSVHKLLTSSLKKETGFADSDVQVLDPAVGTGTFLFYLIEYLHDFFKNKGKEKQWNKFVKEKLLKHLFGFEILMAPYAISHLKLGMKLQEYGFKFGKKDRLGIYLCNTLAEPTVPYKTPFAPWISDEGNAANKLKNKSPVMVILGNPPYKKISTTRTPWADELLKEYRSVDGRPLKEKKIWLQDDYLKFLRFGHWKIEQNGVGILAFITNHGYLDNSTLRGMRQSLMKTFDQIFILNLHGNSKKSEKTPTGGIDENVFDITQGVSIGIFVKTTKNNLPSKEIKYYDKWGLRNKKYKYLEINDVESTKWKTITPSGPNYYFVPKNWKHKSEFDLGWSIRDIFLEKNSGFVTARDKFVIDTRKSELESRISEFANLRKSNDEIGEKYSLHDTSSWSFSDARKTLSKISSIQSDMTTCLYRPFDVRHIFYSTDILERPVYQIQQHLFKDNLALLAIRPQSPTIDYSFVFCTNKITDQCAAGRKKVGAGTTYVFPLYTYEGKSKKLSLNLDFIKDIEKRLKLKFVEKERGDFNLTIGPEDIFYYIYAILHNSQYRIRYAEFLNTEYPKIPLTEDKKLFKFFTKYGEKLVNLHLLKDPSIIKLNTKFPIKGSNVVERGYPKYDKVNGRVYINETQYFVKVPEDVWNFKIGGYDCCLDWLGHRKNYKLTSKEIITYQTLLKSVCEIIKVTADLNKKIIKWPLSKTKKFNSQTTVF